LTLPTLGSAMLCTSKAPDSKSYHSVCRAIHSLSIHFLAAIPHVCRAIDQSTGSSSSNSLKLKGSNVTPSPTKCLLIASTQCRRRECSIALVPSITHKTAIVRTNQKVKQTTIIGTCAAPDILKALASVMFQSTTESCWWASESAQSRR